jgi:branched-chain amino acid transport system permease protein
MEQFVQLVVDGLGMGSIYAALALALVLIFRSTGVVNLAQGELAMFSTFVAWSLVQASVPLALALVTTALASFVAGMAIERVLIRPIESQDPLNMLVVTLGLFVLINAGAGWIWGFETHAFPRVLPAGAADVDGLRVAYESIGTVAVLLAVVGLLYLLFQRTKIGLGMRAVAASPDSSRLVGISVGRMLMLGWGLAAVMGAVAGVLTAPQLFLEPNLMSSVLVYSVAAATLGGFDSPTGAIVGGWTIGVTERLAGDYLGFIGSDLTILVPLAAICLVLLVRPQGLFGSRDVVRT